MRIDSIGIYNNRGLIQNKSNSVASAKSTVVNKTAQTEQTTAVFKIASKEAVASSNLSEAESSQIKQLFGQFDVSALNQVNGRKSNDGPGQFIDITV